MADNAREVPRDDGAADADGLVAGVREGGGGVARGLDDLAAALVGPARVVAEALDADCAKQIRHLGVGAGKAHTARGGGRREGKGGHLYLAY